MTADKGLQVLTINVFHYNVLLLLMLIHVINFDNIRMEQLASRDGFTLKAADGILIVLEVIA